jgi:hypothetical protein
MNLKGTLTLAAIAVIALGMPTAYAGHRHHRSYSNFSIGVGFSSYPYSGYGYYPYGYNSYRYYPYGYSYYPYGSGYPYSYGYYSSYRPVYRGQYANSSVVVRVQERLARAGYYHGAIDGVMGPRTRHAIRAYERDHGRLRY